MKYNPLVKKLTMSVQDADQAAGYLLSAIHYTRMHNGTPLEGYDSQAETTLNVDERPEYCILRAADALGLDLGGGRPGQIDVRKYE
jgi:hypothetical protein